MPCKDSVLYVHALAVICLRGCAMPCEGLCRFMPWFLSVLEDVLCHVKDSVGSCPGCCPSQRMCYAM